jgi:hypothetical protein
MHRRMYTVMALVAVGVAGPKFLAVAPANAQVDAPSNSCPSTCGLDRCERKVDTRDCTSQRDTRECNRCLVSVFGRCQARGNDPTCEIAKAAQNKMYEANKVTCEIQKQQENAQNSAAYAACMSAAARRQALCEIARAACAAQP